MVLLNVPNKVTWKAKKKESDQRQVETGKNERKRVKTFYLLQ